MKITLSIKEHKGEERLFARKHELTFLLLIVSFTCFSSKFISPQNNVASFKTRQDSIVKITIEYGDTIKWRKFAPKKSFKDFPVEEKFVGKTPAQLDFSTCKWGKTYITRTHDGLKSGAVFAGHFALSEWGCGSSCQSCAIIDLRNGKVYAGPFSSQGKEFHIDSSIIIVNPTDSTGIYDSHFAGNIPEQWLWTGTEFQRLE